MKSSSISLGKILSSANQYVIPVYQRYYRWEESDWEKLWRNLDEIRQPAKVGNHFMGFLVVSRGSTELGKNTVFPIVDGQQRITTLSILLATIRNIANRTGQHELGRRIHDHYLVHPEESGNDHFRLLPKTREADNYKAVIIGRSIPGGQVGKAQRWFEKELDAAVVRGDWQLDELFHVITQRLEFLHATLEDENPYNIFKSLNSTGVELEPSDNIRNFVFMQLRPEDHERFDRELWENLEQRFSTNTGGLDEQRFSAFMRAYLMSDGKYIRPKDTFDQLEARYEATGVSPQALAETLDRFAAYYEVITGAKPDVDQEVARNLQTLSALDSSTTHPLLLKLFDMREQGELADMALAKAITAIRDFIVRRYIVGGSSRGYGYLFVGACRINHDDTLQELNDYLVDRSWPDDRPFEEAFVRFPLYGRSYARHILETLERAGGHKEPADLERAQIEHIMPQTLTDAWKNELGTDWLRIHTDWLHRPGNLALSGYNAPLSNAPFSEKRLVYSESNIGITRQLSEYAKWGEAEIRQRGEALARVAAGIWSGPRPTAEKRHSNRTLEPSVDETGLRSTGQLRLRFWQQLQERLAEQSVLINPHKAHSRHWMKYSIGYRGFALVASSNSRDETIDVNLELTGLQAKADYHRLKAGQIHIEQAIGEPLSWYEQPNKKTSFVSLTRHNSPLKDEKTWPEQHAWLLDKLELFHRTFQPLIAQLRGK